MMIDNPYKVLGLEEGASEEDVKKAYRRMARVYHPDLHPDDPEANQKMNEINEAYDALTNRIGIVDLRLMGYPIAVHSDMLFWSKKESIAL
jgi:preprotein translocase subunit Sec63